MRLLLPVLLVAFGLGCSPALVRQAQALPEFTQKHVDRSVVDVPMPDGVLLHTVVHLPDGAGPFPVVVTRTPYAIGSFLDGRCALLTRYGYACVWQHVRGRVQSGGDWVPFEREHDDGLATLAWLKAQPWQDGNVALLGESYMAATQWLIAGDLPPEVKTIVPSVYGTSSYDDLYEHGLWRHEIATAWMVLTESPPSAGLDTGRRFRDAIAHRPRIDMDVVATGHEVPWFRAWASHPDPDDLFWHRPAVEALSQAPSRTRVPVLMIGGWADAFTGPMLDTWARLATQSESTLVMGPWNHLGAATADHELDDVDEGAGLDGHLTQWNRVLAWLDHHLRGGARPPTKGKVVTWIEGADRWVTRDAWPPATSTRTLWMAQGRDPSDCAGRLQDHVAHEAVATYVYDPANPTPSVGGAGSIAGALPWMHGTPTGPRLQGELCHRDDVLGFVSAPLTSPLHVAGPIRAVLDVTTDAADTAFGVRVVERLPSGEDLEIRDALTALSLWTGHRAPVAPGTRTQVVVDTWPIEHVFGPGSQVLVEVVSADFPKLEAHPNTVERWDLATSTPVARQTLFLGSSRVELPVVIDVPGAVSTPEPTPIPAPMPAPMPAPIEATPEQPSPTP